MSKITVQILGTTAGVPTRERAHTSIYLSYDDGEEFCYLLDCGEGTQRQLLLAGLHLMKIDDIFITHWHGDHCLGLPGITDTMGFEGRQRPLAVYAPEAGRIKKALTFCRSMSKFKVIARNVPAGGKRITRLLEKDRFRIVSTPVLHGVPTVAYALVEKDKKSIDMEKAASMGLPEKGELYSELKRKGKVRFGGKMIRFDDVSVVKKGKKVVYSGDTEVCDNLKGLIRGADLLIQDCTYFSGMDSGRPYQHASLPEVLEMVKAEDVKQAVLTHISRKHQDVIQLKELIKGHDNVQLAEDFMAVVV